MSIYIMYIPCLGDIVLSNTPYNGYANTKTTLCNVKISRLYTSVH